MFITNIRYLRNICSLWYRKKLGSGGKWRGEEMVTFSNRQRRSRTASSGAATFNLEESLTFKSVVIVSKPQSNARSWIAFKHKPLLGFVRFFTSAIHGTM